MVSQKLQTAVFCSIVTNLLLLSPGAAGEKPTPQAIAAYATICKATGKAMDLIATFGTDFSSLDLRGVDFRGAHYRGLETNLRGADFSHANLQGAQFGAAILEGANFTGANLDQASFVTASLEHSLLQGASLKGANFRECNLNNANLHGVDLSQVSITGSQFLQADLSQATLAGATNEYGGNFQGSNLTGANLREMRLTGANFQNAILHSANLANCNLEQADFTDADLSDANFSGARVKAALFQGAVGLADSERRRLLAEARRGEFELRRGITMFLDSAWFPVGLFIAVPVVAVATGVLRKRIRRTLEKSASAPTFQFSLFSLLSVTLAIGLFFGLASWSATGAFSYVAACAGYMMTLELVYGRVSRLCTTGILALALGYALANAGLYFVDMMASPFSIFNPLFMLLVVIIGPLLTVLTVAALVVILPPLRARPPWMALAGLVLWMACVGMANLMVIGMAAASV